MIKKLPNQINDLSKLFQVLAVAKDLIDLNKPLTDWNLGEQIIRNNIRGYRNKSLSTDEYLAEQRKKKRPSDRSYETTARDLKDLFESLGFLEIYPDKTAKLTKTAKQLLNLESDELRIGVWRNAFLQLVLETPSGNTVHPYRILKKLVVEFPGIERKKLMLVFEASDDSEREFERICNLVPKTVEQIINETGSKSSVAEDAIKILPAIAEQLGDIKIKEGKAYPIEQVIITEDGIVTESNEPIIRATTFREVTPEEIAPEPNFKDIPSSLIDPTEANKIRQQRLKEHQEIVTLLAELNKRCGFKNFRDPFDCVATKDDMTLLFEVKTILENFADQREQTLKGFGQLKYYNLFNVQKQKGYKKAKEILVFSRKPAMEIIEFCASENIFVVWRENESFKTLNLQTRIDQSFNPDNLL